MTLPVFYTPQEVADRLKVSRRAVYGWIKQGRLKAHLAGDSVRISEQDLIAFLKPVKTAEPEGITGTSAALKRTKTRKQGS